MTPDTPEFSHPIAVAALEKGENTFAIEATATECQALAERLGLPGIGALSASVTMVPKKGGREVLIKGRIAARLTQSCVVTLEAFESDLDADFQLLFAEQAETATERAPEGVDVDAQDPDLPEPIEGGVIDIGEAVAQQLSLELDPFPRAPGAEFQADHGVFDGGATETAGEEGRDNPFAALAALKDKLK